MKKLLLLLLLLLPCFTISFYGQSAILNVDSGTSSNFQNDDGVYRSGFLEKDVLGSVFRFQGLENEGSILDLRGNNYNLKGLNIDLNEGKFLFNISKDSLFYFKNVSLAKINGIYFKVHNGKVLEKLTQGKKLNLFVNFKKIINKALIDKLTGKIIKAKEWKTRKIYYIEYNEGGEFIQVRLKKKEIVNLFDVTNKEKMTQFIKKNKFKSKKEQDLIKIINYYNSI